MFLDGRMILQDFTYDSVNLRNLIYNNSVNARFSSLSGHVSYKPNGDRHGHIRYFQYRPKGISLVSVYIGNIANSTGSGTIRLQPGENDDTLFLDGMVPVDKTLDYVDTWLFSIYVILGTAGLVYASIWLMINIIYRNKKVIKLSSPYLNIVIIIGAMLFYLDIILFGMDEAIIPTSVLNGLCMARVWIVVFAFTLLFGTLFAKTWRVYYIFHSSFHQRKPSKWVIKDGFLILMIGVLLIIDCVFMICFTAIPGTRLELSSVTVPSTDHSLPIQLSICSSNHQIPVLSTLLVYKGILLIIGLFLAFETRNIKIKELNDSPLIAMCVYTTVVLSISLTPIGIILTNYVDIHYGLVGSLTMLGVTIILSTLFVPQAYRLVKDPTGSLIFTKNSPQSVMGGTNMPRLDYNKDTIEYHMKEIDRLKKIHKESDALPGAANKNNSNVQVLSPVDENEVVQVVVSPNDEVFFRKPSPLSSVYVNENGHY
uniref:G-protein coupled receptors family 3 profile domain-containing protein n=1 Tax=Amphimedon queenslandica TaxID=400682 RepID=A0A1X7VVZ8_AMPQE